MKTYAIEETSGAFTGKSGQRLSYRFAAGTVTDAEIDPEVLARLLANGTAKKKTQAPKSEGDEK